jgi:hypothetical protein
MMSGTYYIPGGDAEFDVFFKNIVDYVLARVLAAQPVWTHIPPAEAEKLATAYTDWHTAYEPTLVSHTSVQTAEKNRTRKASQKVLTGFVNRFLRYPPVTDEDRDNMGIPNKKPIKTPVPAPERQVEADLTFPGIHIVELRNIRPVAGPDDDPRSDYGVRIYYGLSGTPTDTYKFRLSAPPERGNDLPDSRFTRKKKERFDFEGESGNTVYFCLRYENAKGGEEGVGPFGPILHATIP